MSNYTKTDRSPLSVNLPYNVTVTPQNKAVFKSYHTLFTASKEDYMSDTATKERNQFLVVFPSH